MRFNIDLIPEELKAYLQWVLMKLESKNGRSTKVPYTVQGYRPDITDPKNLASSKRLLKSVRGTQVFISLASYLRNKIPFLSSIMIT